MSTRTVRLVRVADLHGFREAVVALACGGMPLEARDRLVVVPTRAAAAQLIRSIEHRGLGETGVTVLPDFATPEELHLRLADRLPRPVALLTPAEREVVLGAACRAAIEEGSPPPFRLRLGLIAEILRFYDALRRHQKDVEAFERLAVGRLEPGASDDRGGERLLRQTRFLVSAFRHYEKRCVQSGALDDHALPYLLMSTPASRPWRHVVLTVGDRATDPHGLFPVDWDVLARLPGLARLDVVATHSAVAGSFHERVHQLLPGMEEVRFETGAGQRSPLLLVAPGGGPVQTARDREEEVTGFARWVRHAACTQSAMLDRIALVVYRPLPYVYLARAVLRSLGVPCQLFDALPLAAEPYAAALDLVFSAVSENFARAPSVALLASPHFRFVRRRSSSCTDDEAGDLLTLRDIRALDSVMAGDPGDADALDRLPLRAAAVLAGLVRELQLLRTAAPCAEHLTVLLSFLRRHDCLPSLPPNAAGEQAEPDPQQERQLRARAAILGILTSLRDAYARFDPTPVDFDAVAALVRRWIEGHTFAPRTGESSVHVIDAASAPFGDFDAVQLAGLVDGEWPGRPRRNVFYSPALLRDLGWPPESERLGCARAAFGDLLRLPSQYLMVSTFTLEADALVGGSNLLDEVAAASLEAVEYAAPDVHVTPLKPIARL